MPDSSILTGIDPTNLEQMQHDSQQRLDAQSQQLPTSLPPADIPVAPKGQYGVVAPDQNVNVDKTSYDYNLASYTDMINKGDKQYPGTANQLPEIDLPTSQTSRYLNNKYGFDVTRNNETFYANRQSVPDMLVNGIANAIVKTAAYTVQNLGLMIGAPDAATGGHLGMQDNWLTQAGDSMKNWIEKAAPIYKSEQYQNSGIFGKLGTLGWWTDDAMDRVGLGLSMAIPGGLELKGAGIFSGLMKGVQGAKAMSTGAIWLNGIVGQSGLNAKETREAVLNATGDEEKANSAATKAFWETMPLTLLGSIVEIPQMFGVTNPAKSMLNRIFDKDTGEVLSNAFKAPSVGRTIRNSLLTGLEHGQNESMQVAISRYNEDVAEGKDPRGTMAGIWGDYLDNIHDPNGQNNIALGTIQGIFMTLGGRLSNKITGKTAADLEEKRSFYDMINNAKLDRRYFNGDFAERNDDGTIKVDAQGQVVPDQQKLTALGLSVGGMQEALQAKQEALKDGDFLTASLLDHKSLSGIAYYFFGDANGTEHLSNLLKAEATANEKNETRVNDVDELGREITPSVQLQRNLDTINQLRKVYNSVDKQTRADYVNLGIDSKDKDEVKRGLQFAYNLKAAKYDAASLQLFLNKEIVKNKSLIADLGQEDDDKIIEDPSNPEEEAHNNLVKTNQELNKFLDDTRKNYKILIDKAHQKEIFANRTIEEHAEKFAESTKPEATATTAPVVQVAEPAPVATPATVITPTPVTPTQAATEQQGAVDQLAEKKAKAKALFDQMNIDKANATTPEDKQAVTTKYLKDAADLNKQYEPKQVESTPEQKAQVFESIKNQIPNTKTIHKDLYSELASKINESRRTGDIDNDQETQLLNSINEKGIVGTLFDKPADVEEVKEEKQDKSPIDETLPTVIEDPTIGQTDSDYDPTTADVDTTPLEQADPFSSSLAWLTPSKTITQEEERSGFLDEDPYKQFKQTFLRILASDKDKLSNYDALIMKDHAGLPHSKQTDDDIASGRATYGEVMLITDREGNVINFGPNYEESIEEHPDYKPLVYSFNKTNWQDSEAARLIIGAQRSGLTPEQLKATYEAEYEKQDLARQLANQGKTVPVQILGVTPGIVQSTKESVDANTVITPEMKPTLYIPTGPREAFDPANPTKNKYVLEGNQNLLNGALYATIIDKNNITNYIRLIPKRIGDVTDMFENVKELLTTKYKTNDEAQIARDHLAKLLFLNQPNRPGLKVEAVAVATSAETANITHEIYMVRNNEHIPNDVALTFIQDQRFNVIKSNIDNPHEYVSYSTENGRLVLKRKEDYNKFVLDNTETKSRPVQTSDGDKFIALNSYASFKFTQSADWMRSELNKGNQPEPPGEHTFKVEKNQIAVFRHGQANDDLNGRTSGQNKTPLTKEGKAMATLVAERVKPMGLSHIITSNVLRAIQTSNIIKKAAGIKNMSIDKDLATWDIGNASGIESTKFDENWFIDNPDSIEHDGVKLGETFNTFVNRMIKVYKKLRESALPDSMIVAHSRNIRVWDAYRMNNEQWNDAAVEKYRGLPAEHSFTTFTRPDRAINDNSSLVKKPFKKYKFTEEDVDKTAREAAERQQKLENGDALFSRRVRRDTRPRIREAEIQHINTIFGSEVAQRLQDISDAGATAIWTTSGIKLYRDAKEGDGYHEAWHHFSQMYLDGKEKRGLYDEVRKRAIPFTSQDKRKLNTRTASDYDVEEFIAEDFRKYAASDGNYSRLVNRPFRNNIFRKVLDFLKKFFFGEVNVSKMFDNLYNGKLGYYEPSMNNAWWGKMNSQAMNYKIEEIFPNDKVAKYRDIADAYMGKEIAAAGTDPSMLGQSKKLAQQIYENVYNDFVDVLNKLIDKSNNNEPHNSETLSDLETLTDNWEDFVQYHKDRSKLNLDIPFEVEQDIPEDAELGGEDYAIEEVSDDLSAQDDKPEDEASLVPNWERTGNEHSSWENASPETRALIRMLPAMDIVDGNAVPRTDADGFPILNDYAKTWNNLCLAISDTSKYEDMVGKMSDPAVQRKIPELVELLKRIPDPYKEHNAAEIRQIVKFRTDFNRAYIGLYSGIMKSDGNFYFNEETRRNQDQVKKIWTANFINKSLSDTRITSGAVLIDDETGKYYLNPDKVLSFNMTSALARENFLDLLGLTFSPDLKAQPFYRGKMSQWLANMQTNINELHAAGQLIFNPVYDLNRDFRDREGNVIVRGSSAILTVLSTQEAKYTTDAPSLSYQTAEGTMQYGLSLHNTLSITRDSLNRALTYDDIISNPITQHLNYLNNPYVKGSVFLNGMFNLDSNSTNYGRRKTHNGNPIQLTVGNYNGLKTEDDKGNRVGLSTTSLNTRQKLVFDFNSLLTQGAIEIMRTEASKSSFFTKLAIYNVDNIDPSRSYLPAGISEFGNGFSSPAFRNIMVDGYLRDELDRMKNVDNIQLYKDSVDADKLIAAASGFNLFSDLLAGPENAKEELKDALKIAIKTMTPEEAIQKYRNKIEQHIEKYFEEQLIKFNERLSNENIGQKDFAKSLNSFNRNQLVRAFLANSFVLNVEHTKIFDGDTIYQAHYKDFFKRSKGVSSTGKASDTGDYFGRYMRKIEHNTFAAFVGSKVVNDYKTTKTVNIVDDERPSQYLDIYRKNLKDTNSDLSEDQIDKLLTKYKKMNIGDGQGHITLDFYRQFLRSIDNWSYDQEMQYQVELSRYRLDNADYNSDYTAEQKAYDRDVLRRNGDTVFSYFPPIKMQYHGPIQAVGTFAQVMDKFSVAPLIPSIIKNTPLEQLNKEMLTNGVGYSKFLSGTKKYKAAASEMYNKTGDNVEGHKDLDLSKATLTTHFLEYLKEQINTNPSIHKESIFGSQVRKLIEANIFSNGSADQTALDRHARYKAIIQKIQDKGKVDLFKELGIKEVNGKIGIDDMQKLIGTLQSQAAQRDLNDNVKEYVQYDKDTKQMMYPLETSLNNRSIQDLIMGVVDNRLRRQYVNGDMLIQISSSGFQPNDFKYTGATEDEIKKYGTNGLSFYHTIYDGNGKPAYTAAAQVKVGLNGGFESLLLKKHPDGSPIKTIDRLNALLKDADWLQDDRKSVTIIGYRIPTQGHNSMEFLEVAEFLPPHVGSSVIVPAEIVAKAGSDFDIDKLNIFRPSFDKNGELVNDESKEGDSNRLINLYREILQDPKNFKSLITPNDTNLIKPDIDGVSVALGRRTAKKAKNPVPYQRTEIYRYINSLRKFESLLSASKLLGVFAVNNTFSQILQQSGITQGDSYNTEETGPRKVRMFLLSPEERAKVTTKSGRINLSNKYDVEGTLKQDYLSQLINAAVDAPSDDFLGYGNISYENVGAMMSLINQGVPFDRAYWFMHQPALIQYYNDMRSKDSTESRLMIQAKLLSKFTGEDYTYTHPTYGTLQVDKPSFNKGINKILNNQGLDKLYLDKKTLQDRTVKVTDIPAFLNEDKRKFYNATVFAYFLSLKEQAQLTRNFQSLFSYDTTKTRSPIETYQNYLQGRKVDANKLFNKAQIDKINSASIISPFNNKLLIGNIGVTLMPAQFDKTFMVKSASYITKRTKYKNKAFVKKFISQYESQWMEYMVKTLGKVGENSLSSYAKYLTEGRNSLARRFNELIRAYPALKKDYVFVDKIRPNFPNRANVKKSNLEIYRLFENTTDDQNRYIAEFRKLIDFDDPAYQPDEQAEIRKFFRDMAILGFAQSGFSRSNISFQELVPYEIFADMFKNAVVNFKDLIADDPKLVDEYVDQYIKQFANNESKGIQPWRGRTYYLGEESRNKIATKTGKAIEAKRQLNTEVTPAPYENVVKALPASNIVKDINIPFQSDNIQKILNGTKTTTTRSVHAALAIGLQPGETGKIGFGNREFLVKYMGMPTIEQAGGQANILKSEGVNSVNDFKYQQTKDWFNGKGTLALYRITPIESIGASPVEEAQQKQFLDPPIKSNRQFWPGDEDGGVAAQANFKWINDNPNIGDITFLDIPDGLTEEQAIEELDARDKFTPLSANNMDHFLKLHDKYGNEIIENDWNGDNTLSGVKEYLQTIDLGIDSAGGTAELEIKDGMEELYRMFRMGLIPDNLKDEAEAILSEYGVIGSDPNQLSLFATPETDIDGESSIFYNDDEIRKRLPGVTITDRILSDEEVEENLKLCK